MATPTLTPAQRRAIEALIAVARAAHHAADGAEGLIDGCARLGASEYRALCNALDRLGIEVAGASMAEWALRDHLAA